MTYFENAVDDAIIEGVLDKLTSCAFDIEDGRPTSETLDDYRAASKNWNSLGQRNEKTVAGIPVLEFIDAQAVKGQRRQTVVVLDLGKFRAVFAT